MAFGITRKKIKRGLQVFIFVSLFSFAAIFFLTRTDSVEQAIRKFAPHVFLLIPVFIAFDWLGSGLRLYIFGRVLYPGISFRSCVRANLGNYFMAAVTPAQTGGGPAQIYLLYADGMPAVEATSASLMTFLATAFFLIIAAAFTFAFKGRVTLTNQMLHHLFNYGIFFFLFIGFLVILALAFPNFYREAVTKVVSFISRLRKKDYLSGSHWANSMIDGVDRCHKHLIYFIRKKPLILILGIIISGALFTAKFVLAYVVVVGLGCKASLMNVVLLQVVIVLINYFFPSPGGSGAAELSSAALMASVVPRDLIPYYVILWRLFTTYISVTVGGIVIIRALGKKEKLEIENNRVEDHLNKKDKRGQMRFETYSGDFRINSKGQNFKQ